jgi:hypothetical protein
VAEYSAAERLKRLEHEYSLREELDPAWAARPIAIARHWDRPVLVMDDPGGVPLDELLLVARNASALADAGGQPLERFQLSHPAETKRFRCVWPLAYRPRFVTCINAALSTSKVDQAAAHDLKVLLHTVKSENPQAVGSALTCLRLFGIEAITRMPA